MAKKVEKEEVTKSSVAPLTVEFTQQDLNTLRDKVNEIIANLT